MHFLIDLLPALIVLGVLIFIHELGHFIACKLSGVRVEKFSIGFGPEIFHLQGKETRYAISLIPLGGFVKPSGESSEDIGEEGLRPYDFLAQSPAKRFVIASAGILMNFLLAYVIFSVVFMVGRPILKAKIGGFVTGYPATASELKVGDLVLSMNDKPVRYWKELTDLIYEVQGAEIRLVILRGEKQAVVRVLPKVEDIKDIFGTTRRISRIGILPSEEYLLEKYPPMQAFQKGGEALVSFTVLTAKSIAYLVTGKLSLKMVSGPIGIFAIASKTAHLGFVHVLQLTAFLSVSLAVFNILPFPPLDGGLMLFIAIEAIRRKQVSFRVQEVLTKTGFALLLLLMVVVMYNDLANLEIFHKLKDLIHR